MPRRTARFALNNRRGGAPAGVCLRFALFLERLEAGLRSRRQAVEPSPSRLPTAQGNETAFARVGREARLAPDGSMLSLTIEAATISEIP